MLALGHESMSTGAIGMPWYKTTISYINGKYKVIDKTKFFK